MTDELKGPRDAADMLAGHMLRTGDGTTLADTVRAMVAEGPDAFDDETVAFLERLGELAAAGATR